MKKHALLPVVTFLFLSSQAVLATQTATPHHPEKFILSLEKDPQAGEKVYAEFCAVCHDQDPQIPLGAPRTGIPSDWKSRKKSLDEMTQLVADGLNNMPPRGGCFECTDELLKAAIQYMIPQEKQIKR